MRTHTHTKRDTKTRLNRDPMFRSITGRNHSELPHNKLMREDSNKREREREIKSSNPETDYSAEGR